MIEWSGNRTGVLLNPRMPLNDQEKLERRGRAARLAGLKPPSRMRTILVGGGPMHDDLNEKAGALGWPVLPSYGMSECSSTIAVCDVLLSHIEAREQDHGRLAFRGPSLFTAYITDAGVVDPKVSGWFLTDDVGDVDGRTLHVYGRQGDFIKIGGEAGDLAPLDPLRENGRGPVDGAVVP